MRGIFWPSCKKRSISYNDWVLWEDVMKVESFFESGRRDHWKEAILQSEWSAAPFLCRLIDEGRFFETLGEHSKLLLLTEGDELIAYCTFTDRDDIPETDLTPWIGFVYVFPKHRGHRYFGLLLQAIEQKAWEARIPKLYLSTNHVGLYEKYGFRFESMMTDMRGDPSRIYSKAIPARD